MTRVLFVCTGNICRSPTAEGVARVMARKLGLEDRVHFESAGTHSYHVGEAPDPRTQRAALRRGYDLSVQRARRVTDFDFLKFDRIFAMGQDHLEWLRRSCPREHYVKLRLFLTLLDGEAAGEVPDPYYGGAEGFEQVLDLVEAGVERLLGDLSGK